jgi:hypothetical protein
MAKTVKRPGVITFLGVLGYISGIFKVLFGLVIVLDTNRVEAFATEGLTNGVLLSAGVVMMLLGAFTLFLANSLLSGQKWAQVWYGIVFTLNLVVGIVSTFTHTGDARWSALASAIVAFIVLQLLFTDRVQEYFED